MTLNYKQKVFLSLYISIKLKFALTDTLWYNKIFTNQLHLVLGDMATQWQNVKAILTKKR